MRISKASSVTMSGERGGKRLRFQGRKGQTGGRKKRTRKTTWRDQEGREGKTLTTGHAKWCASRGELRDLQWRYDEWDGYLKAPTDQTERIKEDGGMRFGESLAL